MVDATVIENYLNVRENQPSREGKLIACLEKGAALKIRRAIFGERIEDINVWYQLDSGYYVWSGYVQLASPLPTEKKRVIFTADDYGIIDSVNQGVIRAVQEGQLRSVTCITNFENQGIGSLRNIRKLQQESPRNAKLELGVHLTITSGSPLTGRNQCPLLCRDVKAIPAGYAHADFMDFGNVRNHYLNLSANNRKEFLEQLERELCAQLEVFKNPSDGGAPIPISNLTSHHNSLLFHEDFFDIMKRLAIKYDAPFGAERLPAPLRSLTNIPTLKDNLYMLSKGKILCNQSHLEKLRAQLEALSKPFIRTPDLLNSDHYGPLPGSEISGWSYKNLVAKKVRKAKRMLEDLIQTDGRNHMEFLLHLRSGEVYKNQADYETLEAKPTGYLGIDPRAFDERTAELDSFLKNFPADKSIHDGTLQPISWEEIRLT